MLFIGANILIEFTIGKNKLNAIICELCQHIF